MTSDPNLNADQQEIARQALDLIRHELERKGRSLSIIQDPAFVSEVKWAVKEVQTMKTTDKAEWGESLEYGVLTAQQRKVAANIAAALSKLIVAFKPVDDDPGDWLRVKLRVKLRLETETHDLDFPMGSAELEKWQRHYQRIANMTVRQGSPYDARKRIATQAAAALLRAVALPLSKTRHGVYEQLSAILWGEPGADFSEFL
jgi:hypothetical protein